MTADNGPYVVLVDGRDVECGVSPKEEAHRRGLLHKAFSVFVFDSSGRLLLQRRSPSKYHSGGLWTNTCCSHPSPGEDIAHAASVRLKKEMGFSCPLTEIMTFVYNTPVGNGLVENELDHVFKGVRDGTPDPDPNEVCGWRWETVENIRRDLFVNPGEWTVWFRLMFEEVIEKTKE